MLPRRYIIIILIVTLFAWTANQLLAAFECHPCCVDMCECPSPVKNLCEAEIKADNTTCDALYKGPENTQATLPSRSKADYENTRENRPEKIAIITLGIEVTANPFSYLIEYTHNTCKPYLFVEWFQHRAPPANIHA